MWHCAGSVVVTLTFVIFHCFLLTQSLLSSVGSDRVTLFFVLFFWLLLLLFFGVGRWGGGGCECVC